MLLVLLTIVYLLSSNDYSTDILRDAFNVKNRVLHQSVYLWVESFTNACNHFIKLDLLECYG